LQKLQVQYIPHNEAGFLLSGYFLVGHEISRPALRPNETRDITEVVSKVFTVGGVTKKVYQPLTFAYPDIKEGEEDLPGIKRVTAMCDRGPMSGSV
jgi:hypothetical protein